MKKLFNVYYMYEGSRSSELWVAENPREAEECVRIRGLGDYSDVEAYEVDSVGDKDGVIHKIRVEGGERCNRCGKEASVSVVGDIRTRKCLNKACGWRDEI